MKYILSYDGSVLSYDSSVCVYEPYPDANLYWPFDGDLRDLSGNGNDASAYYYPGIPDPSWNFISGQVNQAIEASPNEVLYTTGLGLFSEDASSIINIPTGTNSFSLSLWIDEDIIIRGTNPPGSISQWYIRTNLGEVEYNKRPSNGSAPVSRKWDISLSGWTHIALINYGVGYEPSIYINGLGTSYAEPSTGDYFGSVDVSTVGSLFIGGKIDQFRLFDRELSSGEIRMLFNNGVGV